MHPNDNNKLFQTQFCVPLLPLLVKAVRFVLGIKGQFYLIFRAVPRGGGAGGICPDAVQGAQNCAFDVFKTAILA